MTSDQRLAFSGLLLVGFGLALIAGRLTDSIVVGVGTYASILGVGLLLYALFISKPETT